MAARRLPVSCRRNWPGKCDWKTIIRRYVTWRAWMSASRRAAPSLALLLDADTLEPLAECVARIPTSMPYVPGLLSFRELPALLRALAGLPDEPDLIFVDGHGIAHPRGLGIAAHLGVVSGLPTIGVAKKILTGHHVELAEARGARVELLNRMGEQIGWVLRSKDRVRPLIISPGNRVSLERAPELVMACVRRHRLPEPTRLADRLASRRDARRDQPSLF